MCERGLGIRTGVLNKQGWENADFPIVCETCLGDNPYLRMQKMPYGQECKICTRPYTVFRWKAGTDGRHKMTVVCQTCSKLKNVCQTCLFDLEYGLPVEVRDKFLDNKIQLPTQEANRDYFIEQSTQNLDVLELPYAKIDNEILQKFKKSAPGSYNRNKAHICSFFVKGICTRGKECPYRHEMPNPDHKGGNSEENIKNRFHGKNDEYAKRILEKIFPDKEKPQNPEDKSITTLVVHKIENISSDDLREVFEKIGKVNSIKMLTKIAMVEFDTRTDAEKAFSDHFGRLVVKNKMLGLTWFRTMQEEEESDDDAEGLLIPGQKFKLKKKDILGLNRGDKPNAPLIPPTDLKQNIKSQHKFLMDVILKNNEEYYPSMDPTSLGGQKKVKMM